MAISETSAIATARQEWVAMWPLPIVAMLGYSGCACFAYSIGVFMTPLTREFGWSRAEISSAFTIQMLIGLVVIPIIGRLSDRIGPRRIALVGILPFMIALSSLGLAGRSIWSWWLLCALVPTIGAGMGPAVWVKAVVSRFSASRGISLAVVLAGIGVGAAIWPVLAALYISHFGWRLTYPAIALTWGVVVLPLTYFFLFGAQDLGGKAAPAANKVAITGIFTSRTFISLAIAGSIVAAINYGLFVHLVPILEASGFTLGKAAALAGLAGLFNIVGRVVTGFLLDFLPTRLVSIAMFLLPVAISALLLTAHGALPNLFFAAVLIGFGSGGDADVYAFIIAKNFDQRVFGSLYGPMIALISLVSSLGPLIAGACFDWRGSYTLFFIGIFPLAAIAAALVGSIPIQQFPARLAELDQQPSGAPAQIIPR